MLLGKLANAALDNSSSYPSTFEIAVRVVEVGAGVGAVRVGPGPRAVVPGVPAAGRGGAGPAVRGTLGVGAEVSDRAVGPLPIAAGGPGGGVGAPCRVGAVVATAADARARSLAIQLTWAASIWLRSFWKWAHMNRLHG